MYTYIQKRKKGFDSKKQKLKLNISSSDFTIKKIKTVFKYNPHKKSKDNKWYIQKMILVQK